MLVLLDFHKVFVLKIDVCAIRLGIMLIQKGGSLAFVGKALSPQHIWLSINQKSLCQF